MEIIQADIHNLKELTILFDGYRQFYKQAPDLNGAEEFLRNRLNKKDSIIYIAYFEQEAVGFTQLYPLFSSVTMQPMLLLNDLYIDPAYRNQGIGESLINRAKDYCRTYSQKGLINQTQTSNGHKIYIRDLALN